MKFLRPSFALAGLAMVALLAPPAGAAGADTSSTLKAMREQAAALRPLFRAKLVREFLDAVPALPTLAPRTVASDSARTRYWSAAEVASLPEAERGRLVSRTLGESFYYNTRYGTPLAYARALELLSGAGMRSARGRRIADFGYGTAGHLRLLAGLGADATGIEVDPLLRALYSEPGDQGSIRGAKTTGTLRLLNGQWPAGEEITRETGGGYDLFISKNTLKNGYLHPAEPVDPRRMVHLGVSDSAFVAALHGMLKPGGLALIYNISPAPATAGKPYIPWADGRCPFPRAQLEAAGFEILDFDRDDSAFVRRMGHALGWHDPAGAKMDLENDLFAQYTLMRRARAR